MKQFLKWLLYALIAIVLPAFLWNVWALDYIDEKGRLVPYLLTPAFAFSATWVLLGFSDAKDPAYSKGWINPFWGWFFLTLIAEIIIVALANT